MSRQFYSRTFSQKSSSVEKQPRFTAPPVIQPKAAKKPKQELPEWKPGGSGRPSPLARLLDTAKAQAKLAIAQPNNKYEQEADLVAEDIVQRINAPIGVIHREQGKITKTKTNILQRMKQKKDDKKIQDTLKTLEQQKPPKDSKNTILPFLKLNIKTKKTIQGEEMVAYISKNMTLDERQFWASSKEFRQLIKEMWSEQEAPTIMAALLEGSLLWKQGAVIYEEKEGKEDIYEMKPNDDFGYWLLDDKKNEPNIKNGTMNCWEGVLYAAYLVGVLSKKNILDFYTKASKKAKQSEDPSDVFDNKLLTIMAGDKVQTYAEFKSKQVGLGKEWQYEDEKPAFGSIMFMGDDKDDLTAHVMLYIKGKGEDAEVMSLWQNEKGILPFKKMKLSLRGDKQAIKQI